MNHYAQQSVSNEDLKASEFREEVLAGLCRTHRTLPCKYFYDERGCELFDQICELNEYYLTRTELAIMNRYGTEMAECLGPSCAVIEFGSGSSVKTRILLDHLIDPVAYIPVEIAPEYLAHSAAQLQGSYRNLQVLPVCADFAAPFAVPVPRRKPRRQIVYFPGSTIGNFELSEAQQLLERIASLCGPGGAALLGIDLQKDLTVLQAAYNDRRGVTAAFNLNLLRRINDELGANFQLDQFRHEARYNNELQRIEMYLISLRNQTVTIGSERIRFRADEAVCTEYSHKYNLKQFQELAAASGLALRRFWSDERQYFAVLYLETI